MEFVIFYFVFVLLILIRNQKLIIMIANGLPFLLCQHLPQISEEHPQFLQSLFCLPRLMLLCHTETQLKQLVTCLTAKTMVTYLKHSYKCNYINL